MKKEEASISGSPEGFRYHGEVLTPSEHQDLVEQIRDLPLKEFEFQGYAAKRRVISYGWAYDFATRLQPPDFSMPSLAG